jgi:hypothetical protein
MVSLDQGKPEKLRAIVTEGDRVRSCFKTIATRRDVER